MLTPRGATRRENLVDAPEPYLSVGRGRPDAATSRASRSATPKVDRGKQLTYDEGPCLGGVERRYRPVPPLTHTREARSVRGREVGGRALLSVWRAF